MKNILVTGGCGFIGSNFIRHMYATYPDYRIYNFDALTYAGNPENIADIALIEGKKSEEERRYVFVQGDVADKDHLQILFDEHKFAFVFHFAAETHVDRSFFGFSGFVRTNVDGTLNLAAMVQAFGGRMVHVSTDEVYGSIPEEDGFVDESAPFWPSNPYASSKAAADMLLQSFIKNYDANIMIVRGTNNYGPFQYPEKLIPMGITNLIAEEQVPIHGNGDHLRQWIHTEDFCRAIDLVGHKGKPRGIYNVAGEHESNLSILNKIAVHLGKDLDKHKHHTPDRPGADMRYAIDSSLLETELGWSRRHRLEVALPAVVDWYVANEPWWVSIKKKREYLDHYAKQKNAEWH